MTVRRTGCIFACLALIISIGVNLASAYSPSSSTSGTPFGVIGSTGSLGSYLSLHPDATPIPRPSPSSASYAPFDPNDFVIAAVPITSLHSVLSSTPSPTDRSKFCFLCNGIIPPSTFTIIVPWFGVKNSILISSNAPPTIIYGVKSPSVQSVLQSLGINSKIAQTEEELREAQMTKLMWSSSMWLLCASFSTNIEGVLTNVDSKNAYRNLIKEYSDLADLDFSKSLKKLDDYNSSEGMRAVTPSRELAEEEFQFRNGVWLKMDEGGTFHRELLSSI